EQQSGAANRHDHRDDLVRDRKIAIQNHALDARGVISPLYSNGYRGRTMSASCSSLELTRNDTRSAASGLISNRTRSPVSMKRIIPPLLIKSSESPMVKIAAPSAAKI